MLEKPDLYVLVRFLERLSAGQRTFTKADLQLAVRLNYDQFRRYLDYLRRKDLATWEERGRGEDIIQITPLGRAAYERLVAWIREWVGDGPF